MLTILAASGARLLASKAAARQVLGLQPGLDEQELERTIARASNVIEAACQQRFNRARVTETVKSWGGVYLKLGRTPVVAVSTAMLRGAPIIDFEIDDPAAGLLYRAAGWDWTNRQHFGFAEWYRPGDEEPLYSVTYTAGFILPEDDIESSAVIVTAGSQTFSGLPALPPLVAGDLIETAGFAQAANNGRFTVSSATGTAITVNEALTDEPAAAEPLKRLKLSSEPESLELACLEVVQLLWRGRGRDPAISRQRLGDIEVE